MTLETNFLRPLERQCIFVHGMVQEVGFRPYVYGLVRELELARFVLNDNPGVTIEVQGSTSQMEFFIAGLIDRAPSLARVDFIQKTEIFRAASSDFAMIRRR